MARRARKSRPWLRRVLILLGLVLVGAFLFFRPVLFLPPQVRSRIAVDYECPFPLKADVSLPDYVPTMVDGGPAGVPDKHWGERRVAFASQIWISTEHMVPELRLSGDDPKRYRVIYHGEKITESVEHRERNPAPPWDFRIPRFGDGARNNEPEEWVRRHLACLGLIARRTPPWLSSLLRPRGVRISRTSYAYDIRGRLTERRTHVLPREPGFGNVYLDEEPRTSTERFLHDDDGHVVGHLCHEGGSLTSARISVVRGTWPETDKFCYRCPTEHPFSMNWARYNRRNICCWSAKYDADGFLSANDEDVAGFAHFHNANLECTAAVDFGRDGRIVADEHGKAVSRYYWNTAGTWYAVARYRMDGRLVRSREAVIVTRSDDSGLPRVELWYNHLRTITGYQRYPQRYRHE